MPGSRARRAATAGTGLSAIPPRTIASRHTCPGSSRGRAATALRPSRGEGRPLEREEQETPVVAQRGEAVLRPAQQHPDAGRVQAQRRPDPHRQAAPHAPPRGLPDRRVELGEDQAAGGQGVGHGRAPPGDRPPRVGHVMAGVTARHAGWTGLRPPARPERRPDGDLPGTVRTASACLLALAAGFAALGAEPNVAGLLAAGAAAVLYGSAVRLVTGVATGAAGAGVCLVLVAAILDSLGARPTPEHL